MDYLGFINTVNSEYFSIEGQPSCWGSRSDGFQNLSMDQIDTIERLNADVTEQTFQTLGNTNIFKCRNKLNAIHASILAYKPAWYQWIFHYFNGTLAKHKKLAEILPKVIQKVETVALPLFQSMMSKKLEGSDAEKKQIIARKIEWVIGAKKYLEANDIFAKIQEEREQARKEKSMSNNQRIEREKDEKVLLSKANEYFDSTLKKLEGGENVPLPSFFHASRTPNDVVKLGHLMRSTPNAGGSSGVYISQNDEANHTYIYGNVTFAIDDWNALRYTHAICSSSQTDPGSKSAAFDKYISLWAVVTNIDIPVHKQTIAYIAVPDADTVSSFGKDLVAKYGLKVPVIERRVSNLIHRIFEEVRAQRILPTSWKSNVDRYQAPYPPNIKFS